MKLFVGESDIRIEGYLELVLDSRSHHKRMLSTQKLNIVNVPCVASIFRLFRHGFKIAPSGHEIVFFNSWPQACGSLAQGCAKKARLSRHYSLLF